jgi:hypothetical protein
MTLSHPREPQSSEHIDPTTRAPLEHLSKVASCRPSLSSPRCVDAAPTCRLTTRLMAARRATYGGTGALALAWHASSTPEGTIQHRVACPPRAHACHPQRTPPPLHLTFSVFPAALVTPRHTGCVVMCVLHPVSPTDVEDHISCLAHPPAHACSRAPLSHLSPGPLSFVPLS